MITFIINNKSRPKASVIMIVSYAGRQYRIPVGKSLPVSRWSQNRRRAKVNADFDGSDINETIERYDAAARSVLKKCVESKVIPEECEFREAIRQILTPRPARLASTADKSLSEYLENTYIPRYRNVREVGTIKKYMTALNKLKEYERTHPVVRFSDVDIDFYNAFRSWFWTLSGRTGAHYSENYFGSVIKIIKQAYRESREIDHMHDGSGTEGRGFKVTSEQGAAIYLTTDELRMIEECDLSSERIIREFPDLRQQNRENMRTSLIRARSLFLIGCYTGLRVSDFSRLDLSNIDNNRIRIRTHKTATDVVIPVHPVIRRILDSGFSFDIHLSEQKMNERIKDVCRLSGIDSRVTIYRTVAGRQESIVRRKYELVCNHTARRSFATNAAKSGVPLVMIMKILGMTRESTLMKYLRQSAEENADLLEKTAFFQG